jgi:hypothetical protein
VFLNDRQRVVGFGENLPGGIPPKFSSLDTPTQLAWVGFVNLHIPSTAFAAYALELDGKALIRVGKVTSIPSVREVSAEQVGTVLNPLNWHIDGSWLKHGPLPAKPPNMANDSDYYDSWAGSDANTGSIRSDSFAVPAGDCIVLSGANGPSTGNLSETLVDAETHRTIASMPLDDRDMGWRYWKVDVPASTKHLQIVAEDNGRDWGEWLRIGEPRLCK